MHPLATLREQHDELSRLLLETFNAVRQHRKGDDASGLAFAFSHMVKLLREHLAIEDEWLYPEMVRAGDAQASALALEMQQEMGSLADEVEEFYRRWSTSAMIGGHFDKFQCDALALLSRVDNRIAREDRHLFPKAVDLGLGRPASAA